VPVLEGFGVLWINAPADDLKEQSDVYQQLHMSSAAFAEEHPEVVAAYVRAIAAAHDLIGSDPEAASAIYKAAVPDLDDTARDESVRSVAPAFNISPVIDQARFELTLENYNATAADKVTVDFADAVVGG
jgi:ABC-type nitrate/sulfonate/bicarbonate transport system substrate-binding protein